MSTKVPLELRDIYKSFLIQNYSLFSENLRWAFPNTYKIHVSDGNWSIPTGPIMSSVTVQNITDSVVRTYLLQPGVIRKIMT